MPQLLVFFSEDGGGIADDKIKIIFFNKKTEVYHK